MQLTSITSNPKPKLQKPNKAPANLTQLTSITSNPKPKLQKPNKAPANLTQLTSITSNPKPKLQKPKKAPANLVQLLLITRTSFYPKLPPKSATNFHDPKSLILYCVQRDKSIPRVIQENVEMR
ncbi:hypothetical protein KM043_014885 [Ampulex compressa]|nr:hypothetical protein KM043_014885 [Ampulex compressa]